MHANRPDRAKLIALAVNLIMLLGLCWISIPEHRRAEIGMRISHRMRRSSQRLAQTVAGWAMQHDLAGNGDTAALGYELAYNLMTGPYQTATRWYERGRSVQ